MKDDQGDEGWLAYILSDVFLEDYSNPISKEHRYTDYIPQEQFLHLLMCIKDDCLQCHDQHLRKSFERAIISL